MTKPNTAPELWAFCGTAGVKTRYKTKLFGKGESAVVIENVPLRHCDNCGESYDDILAHPEKQSVTRQISVVSLAA